MFYVEVKMLSKIFGKNVVALELIRSLYSTVLFREEEAKEPLLYYYKTVSMPIKGGGKVNIYYE
jgi:hypothetical protein